MQRVTITIDSDLATEIHAYMERHGYMNRSAAIRALARTGLRLSSVEAAPGLECVATLSALYSHAARELPKRLSRNFQAHYDVVHARLRIHIDDSCLEVIVLKGNSVDVKSFANCVIAECGVRYGNVVYVAIAAAKTGSTPSL